MQKITLPERPRIIKQGKNSAVFEIRSCFPGYGMTIGNAFRRVLLSSMAGSAITSVKINKVNHEFSTIPGVIEDVIEIMLNLKKIRFKMYGNEPVKLVLKVSGEREVKASDIETKSDIEVVNKDAKIATITDKKGKLEMEIKVEKGIGYLPVDQRDENEREIGNIAIDAIFTPIINVNYKVENMRVGKMTNYDKLILEIETDGSVTPEEAFRKASKLLVEHFNLFREKIESGKDEVEIHEKKERAVKEEFKVKSKLKKEEADKKREDLMKMSVEGLKLQPRILRVLNENKIKTIKKIIGKSESDLKSLSGMGDKGIKEIKRSLSKLGLSLKND